MKTLGRKYPGVDVVGVLRALADVLEAREAEEAIREACSGDDAVPSGHRDGHEVCEAVADAEHKRL